MVKAEVPVAHIGLNDVVFEAPGIARCIRVPGLPNESLNRQVVLECQVALWWGDYNPLCVSSTREDGNIIRSRLAYVIG